MTDDEGMVESSFAAAVGKGKTQRFSMTGYSTSRSEKDS